MHSDRSTSLGTDSASIGMLLIALLLSLIHVHQVEATFLTQEELEKQTCYSSVSGFVSKVSVASPPTLPVDILEIPGAFKKYFIGCMQVIENGPVLAPSQIGLCSSPALLQICYAYVSTPTTWVCRPAPDYQRDPNIDTFLGATNDQDKKIKIQWIPQSNGVLCYPRDLTFLAVASAVVPEESNTAANVAFIVVVCIVLLLAGGFGTYQLRKVLRKFWKKEKSRPATHMTEVEHRNTLKAIGGVDPEKVEGRDRLRVGLDNYRGDDAGAAGDEDGVIYSSGPQYAVINEGNTELRAQPLPKPWYLRAEYDLSKLEEGSAGDGDADEGGESPSRKSPKRRQKQESISRLGADESDGGGGGTKGKKVPPTAANRHLRYSETPKGRERSTSYFVDMYGEETYDDAAYSRGGRGSSGASRAPAEGKGKRSTRVNVYDPSKRDRPMPMYDVDTGTKVFPTASGGAADEEDDEDGDIVLTCTDCLLPIRGAGTPQHCAVTGKRHY
jgi:hypothetical protein